MQPIPSATYKRLATLADANPFNPPMPGTRYGLRLVPFSGAAFPRTIELMGGADMGTIQVHDPGWISLRCNAWRFSVDPSVNRAATDDWGAYLATSEDDLRIGAPIASDLSQGAVRAETSHGAPADNNLIVAVADTVVQVLDANPRAGWSIMNVGAGGVLYLGKDATLAIGPPAHYFIALKGGAAVDDGLGAMFGETNWTGPIFAISHGASLRLVVNAY